jgi:hypothetical protein
VGGLRPPVAQRQGIAVAAIYRITGAAVYPITVAADSPLELPEMLTH